MMDKIDLFTGPAPAKPANFVATVAIPTFLKGKEPDVITWGDRTFAHRQLASPKNFQNQAYVEVFAVVALETVEG